jgi:hypothetical protein
LLASIGGCLKTSFKKHGLHLHASPIGITSSTFDWREAIISLLLRDQWQTIGQTAHQAVLTMLHAMSLPQGSRAGYRLKLNLRCA